MPRKPNVVAPTTLHDLVTERTYGRRMPESAVEASPMLPAAATRIALKLLPVIMRSARYACSPPGRVAIPAAVAYSLASACGGHAATHPVQTLGVPKATHRYGASPYLVQSMRHAVEQCGCSQNHDTTIEYLHAVEQSGKGAGRGRRFGANIGRLWKIAADSIYKGVDPPSLAVREAMQNSIDAVRKAYRLGPNKPEGLPKGQGWFNVDYVEVEGVPTLRLSDNGIGMDEQTLADKFFSLGDTGKDVDDPDAGEAAGGFGLAKAVILAASPDNWEVWTRDVGARPSQNSDADYELFDMPYERGLRITLGNIPNTEDWSHVFGDKYLPVSDRIRLLLALSHVPDVELYYNSQPVASSFPANKGSHLKQWEAADWGPNTTVKVRSYSRRPDQGAGMFYIRLNGLFQFAVGGRGALPNDIVVDVTTKERPGNITYPFEASRLAFQSRAYQTFRDMRTNLIQEAQSASTPSEYETFMPDSADARERAGAAQVANALQEALSDPELAAAMQTAMNEVAAFITGVEVADRAVQEADQGGESPEGEANPYATWRDIALTAEAADVNTPEGRKILAQAVQQAIQGKGLQVDVEAFTHQGVGDWQATQIMDAIAESGGGLATSTTQQVLLDKVAEVAEQSTANLYAGSHYQAEARKEIRKKRSELNPFGGAAMIKVSRQNYDKAKAKKFMKNAAKYVPYLVLWDTAARMMIRAGGIRTNPVKVGFVLDDSVRAVATASGDLGDMTYYVLANPDELKRVVDSHPNNPLTIATWLHHVLGHELTHLPRLGHGHNEEFVREREALGVQTAGLLPVLEQLVLTVMKRQRPVPPAEAELRKALARLEKKCAKVKPATRQTAIVAAAPDLVRRLDTLAEYSEFRHLLRTHPGMFLPAHVDVEAFLAALDANPEVAASVITQRRQRKTRERNVERLEAAGVSPGLVQAFTAATSPTTVQQAASVTPAEQQQVLEVMSSYLTRIKRVAKDLPFVLDATALYFMILDPLTPSWVKVSSAAALIYVLNTVDLIPDTIPVAGWADDAAVVYAAAKAAQAHLEARHWQQAEAWLHSEGLPRRTLFTEEQASSRPWAAVNPAGL